jgi:hypothetical protein
LIRVKPLCSTMLSQKTAHASFRIRRIPGAGICSVGDAALKQPIARPILTQHRP